MAGPELESVAHTVPGACGDGLGQASSQRVVVRTDPAEHAHAVDDLAAHITGGETVSTRALPSVVTYER